jgi:hypothetical protein
MPESSKRLIGWVTAAAFLTGLSGHTIAQTPGDEDAHPVENSRSEGQLVYEPEFFVSANPTTAHDMVRRLPGFQIDNGDVLRGFGVSVGNTLINGSRPVSKAEPVSRLLQRIPASRVARIELIRGGAPGIDMGGHSVIANVVLTGEALTRHALEGETLLFSGGPQLFRGNYDFTSFSGDQEWRIRVGSNPPFNDGTGKGRLVRTAADGELLLEEHLRTGFDADSLEARLGWLGNVGAGGLEVGVGYQNNDFETSRSLTSDQGERQLDNMIDARKGDLALRYDRPLANGKWLEARFIQELARDDLLSESLEGGHHTRFDSTQDSGESILRTVVRWMPASNISVETGGEMVYNFLDADQSLEVNGEPIALPLANTRVTERRAELTNQVIWRYRDDLTLEAGINLEHSTIRQTGETGAKRSFFYPKPRFATIWSAPGDNQFRLSVERELGQLNFSDFAASTQLSDDEVLGGNGDLRPQQRWITELAWEKRFNGDGVFTLTARRDRIVDAIDVIPMGENLTAIGNIGDGRLYRVAGDLRVPLDRFGIEGAFVRLEGRYDNTRVTDPTTGQSRPLSNVREFEGWLRFEHDLSTLPLTWGVSYLPYYRHPVYHPDQFRYFSVRNYALVWAEYQFTDNLDLRVQMMHWNDFEQGRDRYADRQSQAILFSERQHIDPREYLNLRLRFSF